MDCQQLGVEVSWNKNENAVEVFKPESTDVKKQLDQMINGLTPTSPEEAVLLWMKGFKGRNGALQYAAFSEDLRKQTYQEFNENNWVTCCSSPWIENEKIVKEKKINDHQVKYLIEYDLVTSAGSSSSSRTIIVEKGSGVYDDGWLIAEISAPTNMDDYDFTTPGVKEAHADSQEQVKVTWNKVQSSTEEMEIDLNIPVISGLKDADLEKKINQQLETKALEFKEEIEKNLEEVINEYEHITFPYSAVTDFETVYNKNGLLSIKIYYYSFTGGAHGFTFLETINVDTEKGKILEIKDFFKANENYQELIINEIKNKIAANPENYFPEAIDQITSIPEDQLFSITDQAIVLYYGLYELAPYAAGIQEFAIPVTALP